MKEINILATSDVHGAISENSPGTIYSAQGIKDHFSNSVLIDNGDFFIGGPLTTFFSTEKEVSPLTHLANDLDYDVMVPGNHDFDHGFEYLKTQIPYLNANYVCCNIFDQDHHLIFDPYTIKDIAGVKVGVIGVLTSRMSMISEYSNVKDLVIKDAKTELEKTVQEIREDVDILIVAYHGGIEKDLETGAETQYNTGEDEAYKLASEIDGIDGLICGHQHRLNLGTVNNTQVIQCGVSGNCVGRMKFSVEDNNIVHSQAEILDTKDLHSTNMTAKNYYKPEEYEAWLNKEVDAQHLTTFLNDKFNRKNLEVFISLSGNTIGDLLNAFPIPYGVRMYRLNNEEFKDFLTVNDFEYKKNMDLENYHVLTNSMNIPDYRLTEQFVYNIFDEYLYYLYKNNLI